MNDAFETCYDNIWDSIDPSQVNDWINEEYNRGCWDTWLRSPSNGGSAVYPEAYANEHAAFPDGRYAVEITATSHGGVVSSQLLPSECILRPDAPVRGIIVDNYVPHVDSVIVYNDDSYPNPFVILYKYGYATDYLLSG
ncbi:MAG: hypothetical protein K8S24_01000, partial [Candidatus Aegiribacteria sp.]|nr:hypothetical protein [Candidatus Aegiribacteria sp.]